MVIWLGLLVLSHCSRFEARWICCLHQDLPPADPCAGSCTGSQHQGQRKRRPRSNRHHWQWERLPRPHADHEDGAGWEARGAPRSHPGCESRWAAESKCPALPVSLGMGSKPYPFSWRVLWSLTLLGDSVFQCLWEGQWPGGTGDSHPAPDAGSAPARGEIKLSALTERKGCCGLLYFQLSTCFDWDTPFPENYQPFHHSDLSGVLWKQDSLAYYNLSGQR